MLLDKSSSVRVFEIQAILLGTNISDTFALIFGHGLGGTLTLEPTHLYSLDKSDYSAREIASNRFNQPHFFLTYWLLKFGIFGSVTLLAILFLGLRQRSTELHIFLIAFPALLWQAYWSPGYALYMGFLWASAVMAAKRRTIITDHDHVIRLRKQDE